MNGLTILVGDCREQLRTLDPESVDCVVTSPPYLGLRDYGKDGQIGREETLDEYIEALVEVFAEVHRVLRPTGTLWLNLGDCYAGGGKTMKTRHRSPESMAKAGVTTQGSQLGVGDVPCPSGLKPKDLMLIPARVAIALQEWGWWVRSEITWAKAGGGMPEPVKDRPSASTEKIWLLTKSGSGYYYDYDASALPVADATVRGVEAAKRALARGEATDLPQKHAGERNDPGLNTPRGKAEAMARLLPRSHNSKTGFSGRWDATMKGRAKTFDGKWSGGGPSGGMYGRARELKEEWTNGTRITRRLRNYEPAPEQVWEICPAAFPGAHFATFPAELVERCLTAGCPPGGRVLDPFGGAGTTALVALRTGREAVLCELSEEYAALARERVESGGRLDTRLRRERMEQGRRERAEKAARMDGLGGQVSLL